MATSTRRFVSKLGHKDTVDQVFLASDKQLRPNRNGNLYLQVELSDRSGLINARMWNASDSDYRGFENGDYVHVDGTTQLFQGAVQLIANSIRKADRSEVDEDDFVTLSGAAVDKLATGVGAMLRKMQSEPLRNLAECFLMDETFMGKYVQAPAGIKNHHAYRGGLIEHVESLMNLVLLVAPRYAEIDVDLLLMGTFLHDMGKIDELSYEKDLAYTDQGQLLGHIILAMSMLDEKIRESEKLSGTPFPEQVAVQLKHLIVSHHGEYEYGSPKLPMTLEAVMLHYLDNMDAKLHQFSHLMRSDPNVDSVWTQYHGNLGRKLFKGDS